MIFVCCACYTYLARDPLRSDVLMSNYYDNPSYISTPSNFYTNLFSRTKLTMAFPRNLLSHSTWRHLGLGLTTTVFGLGVLALVSPTIAGKSLGVEPATSEGHSINKKAMVFLGIRDVAVASTLFWFHSEGKTKEMGVLLLSWVLVCATDTWVAMQASNGWDTGIGTLLIGGAATAFIGAGLFQA